MLAVPYLPCVGSSAQIDDWAEYVSSFVRNALANLETYLVGRLVTNSSVFL